jgi:PAS domain S-box-containing protein
MLGNRTLPFDLGPNVSLIQGYPWFSLFTCFVCLIVGLAVYYLDKKSNVNRLFTAIMALGAFWSLTEFLLYEVNSFLVASILNKTLIIWPFYFVLLLHFTLVYTNNELLKHKVTYVFLYVPAAVFAAIDLTTNLISSAPVQFSGGYQLSTPLLAQSLVSTIDNMWSLAMAIAALVVCILFHFKNVDQYKTQTKLISIGLIFPIITSGFITAAILSNVQLPKINSITTFLLSVFIAYAIWRYKLFNKLSPAIAAENIVSAMPDPLILANPEGKIIRVNKEFVDFSGYSGMEVVGKPILGFIDKASDKALFEMLKTQEIKNFELTFYTKTNEARFVQISASEVHDKRGHDLGFACVIHDITMQKQMAAKLVASERFATIGQLAGMVSHDLRNPLSSMSAATYYLKSHYGGQMDDTGKEMLQAIEKSIDYSNKIVKDLLDYSRDIKLELETTTPHSLLATSLGLIKVPPNVELVNNCSDDPKFTVDVGKVSRVFVNLITNAFDAMPNGGTLTISNQKTADALEIAFKDTGTGISPQSMSNLWTPLFTTKTKGMGLGLPICKRIVEAHGGKITVESEQGNGTKFKVVLPLNKAD